MPSLTFVLPYWLYWGGLAVFPLIAMYLVRRSAARRARSAVSLPIAYMLLATGGFVGIHRFYLRSSLGILYLPLFAGILYSNDKFRGAREIVSRAASDLEGAKFELEHFGRQVQQGIEGAAARLETAKQTLEAVQSKMTVALTTLDSWDNAGLGLAIAIGIFLLVDAFLLPAMVRRRQALEPAAAAPAATASVPQVGTGEAPAGLVRTPVTDALEWINVKTGVFVAYWAVIAVFVYYYEVVARYVFNSPTNWVHESMFLMFGMQYMLCGAFAYREDQHVRVDILYAKLPPRGRAWADIVTSVFFFIFIGVMLWTGARFAMDAIGVGEVSFTEWAIQYWPVKLMIPIGAALMLLQGVAKLIKDIVLVAQREG